MAKSINEFENKSFSELDIIPGQVMALDNNDFEYPHPFLLAVPEKVVKGFEDAPNGLKVLYWGRPWAESEREEWTVHTKGKVLGLWSPRCINQKKYAPSFFMADAKEFNNSYVVEKAYSGGEAIQNALQEFKGDMRLYADCMKKGKLITERGMLGKLVKNMGLEALLPNQLRFALF